MGLLPKAAVTSGFYLYFPLIDIAQTMIFVFMSLFTPADMLAMIFPDASLTDETSLAFVQLMGFMILTLCVAEAMMLLLGHKAIVFWMRFQLIFMVGFAFMWYKLSPKYFFSPLNLYQTPPFLFMYFWAGFVHYKRNGIPLSDGDAGYTASGTEGVGLMAY
ncbi:unnamed protein product [Amoebophrya sp. A120]|nr:unnamed protein product [Amoebophrya sp. A120]|eukprot:GSA120T00007807001.1